MPAARQPVRTGLAQLLSDPAHWLGGRRFALVTNTAAQAPDGGPGYAALAQACPEQLQALFVGEHGLEAAGAAGAPVEARRLPNGLPVLSLYSPGRRAPSPAMLAGLQLLVIDLQELGIRWYTYAATMLACLQAAAMAGVPALILDRPNPLGGLIVEGPGVLPAYNSFVGALDVPVRHGLTLAELSLLAAARSGWPREAVAVVPMASWQRQYGWAETGLTWLPPSPAARSLNMARLYPALCLVEGTNLSEGRGTDSPLELAGAPWLDGSRLAQDLTRDYPTWLSLLGDGLTGPGWPVATPACFVPTDGKQAGQRCYGVRLDAPPAGVSLAAGISLLAAARAQDPGAFRIMEPNTANTSSPHYHLDLLAGGAWLRESLEAGVASPQATAAAWRQAEQAHRHLAADHLLYGSQQEWLGTNRAPASRRCATPLALDVASPAEVAATVLDSARRAVAAVERAQGDIAQAITAIASRLATGGRLIYIGAGTSGRLGLLDASECEPTFGCRPGQVLALLAGGPEAMVRSREGAEDDRQAAVADLQRIGVNLHDVVVGIAASGRTPYTVAGLEEACRCGALTVAVISAPDCPLAVAADLVIVADPGPEPLAGSTRLGAGTAQKLICNAISTGVFAKLGYVFADRMVGVQVANQKLLDRAQAIVRHITGASPEQARLALDRALAYDRRLAVRIAILMLRAGVDATQAGDLLQRAGESLRAALSLAGADTCGQSM